MTSVREKVVAIAPMRDMLDRPCSRPKIDFLALTICGGIPHLLRSSTSCDPRTSWRNSSPSAAYQVINSNHSSQSTCIYSFAKPGWHNIRNASTNPRWANIQISRRHQSSLQTSTFKHCQRLLILRFARIIKRRQEKELHHRRNILGVKHDANVMRVSIHNCVIM